MQVRSVFKASPSTYLPEKLHWLVFHFILVFVHTVLLVLHPLAAQMCMYSSKKKVCCQPRSSCWCVYCWKILKHTSSFFCIYSLYPLPPYKFGGGGGLYWNHSIHLSLRLSVCPSVCLSVVLSMCPSLSRQYLKNCATIPTKTWYGGVISWGRMLCIKTGLLSSVSRS